MLNPGCTFRNCPNCPSWSCEWRDSRPSPGWGRFTSTGGIRSGYTNDGNLIGSWIGRQAQGGQAWIKYSFTARNSLQLGYRHQEVDKFLAGGGRLNDFSAEGEYRVGPRMAVSGRAQYEQWDFPALSGQKTIESNGWSAADLLPRLEVAELRNGCSQTSDCQSAN